MMKLIFTLLTLILCGYNSSVKNPKDESPPIAFIPKGDLGYEDDGCCNKEPIVSTSNFDKPASDFIAMVANPVGYERPHKSVEHSYSFKKC